MTDYKAEIDALGTVLGALANLSEEGQKFVLQTAAHRLGVENVEPQQATGPVASATPTIVAAPHSSETEPKHFIEKKQPTIDTERVACLAYFLCHYRDQREFKTTDITKLNTEAAQPTFSNASQSVKRAENAGYIVRATGRGLKQISALGEAVVSALPDKDAVRSAVESNVTRPRRKNKTTKKRS